MSTSNKFDKLLAFLKRLPAVDPSEPIGRGGSKSGNWWVKFRLDTKHELAWRHVQELGFVLNWVSVTEPLPTQFIPVSPPPYLNGGEEFLMWVIQSTDPSFTPDQCAEWLEGRLPRPVEDPKKWKMDEAESG